MLYPRGALANLKTDTLSKKVRYSIIHVNSFVRIEDARFKRLRRKPYSYFCILESPLKYTYLPFQNTLCITHYKILSFRILSQSRLFSRITRLQIRWKSVENFSRERYRPCSPISRFYTYLCSIPPPHR